MLLNVLVVHRLKPHSKEGSGPRLETMKPRIFITEVQWNAGLIFLLSISVSLHTCVQRAWGGARSLPFPFDPFQKAWSHLGCDTEASRKLTCSLHGFFW